MKEFSRLFFEADDGANGVGGGDGQNGGITLTKEQQEYFDAKLNEQYAKLSAKLEKRYEERVGKFEEAERLKNMNENERAKEELKIANEKIAEFSRRELVNQFKVELASKSLPQEIADKVSIANAEQAKSMLDFFVKIKDDFEKPHIDKYKAVNEELENLKKRGTPPKVALNNAKVETANEGFKELFNQFNKN